MEKDKKIIIAENGPYIVSGNLPLEKEIMVPDEEGNPKAWQAGEKYPNKENYALCRCGRSQNKPYCDGTHTKINFDGKETASTKKYSEQAEKVSGPNLDLYDAPDFCAGARFCHRGGGTWNLTQNSDNLKSKNWAIEEACNCPSGRLVACDKKTGQPIESKFEKSIGVVEDPGAGVSGPLHIKGGIPIELADGTKYEERNRVTLCRCGKSKNKPFCDGSHITEGFDDGDRSLKR
jgi:CDGSH-type Zn-finger protein